MSNKTAQELALREKIIQVRRDNTDCGCVPCDSYCREMRELVTNVIDDVLAEIDASFKALTPPTCKENGENFTDATQRVKENDISLHDMPDNVYLYESGICGIGDLGFTSHEPKENYIKYVRADSLTPPSEASWDNPVFIGGSDTDGLGCASIGENDIRMNEDGSFTVNNKRFYNEAQPKEGYALVPVQPTASMYEAGANEYYTLKEQHELSTMQEMGLIYKAMVSAHLKEQK